MLAKLRNTARGYGRKNTGREVYQQSFIQNICEGMIKPAVNATLGTESTERRSDTELKLNELQNNGKGSGMGFSGIRDKGVQSNCRLPAQHLETNEKDLCHWLLPDSG